ncbi:hypothetical protein [Marininema halotolerans]|nr:hypothetical protein [Marininema halotolerans]
MKKVGALAIAVMVGASVFSFGDLASASPNEPYVGQIVKMQPGFSGDQVVKEAERVAKMQHRTKEQVLKQMYTELKKDYDQGKKEEKAIGGLGNSDGDYKIRAGKKGDIYYTDSKTGGVNHGHVGMYLKSNVFVESTPDKKHPKLDGVHRKYIYNRTVRKGAIEQRVKVSKSKRYSALKWADSRVSKDKYSNNFSTNRLTSHYGKKNCSKLIWSAYKLKAKIDLDKDKGAGVYPRDIRDYKKVYKIKTIAYK